MRLPNPSAALIASALLAAPLARANDPVVAEALFREGRRLMDAGNYAEACPKLAESHAQDPATGTLLALAMCQEADGKTASAWASYAEVAARAKREGRADREQAARERMAALEPGLSRLKIVVAEAPEGLVVKRDGREVGRGAWGTPVPMDPGEHVVEATAPGKRPWSAKLRIGAEGDQQTVQIPALEDEPVALGPITEPTPMRDAAPGADAGVSVEEGPPLRTIGLVVGGAGLVGLGVSGFFGLRARSLNEESKRAGCDDQNRCPEGAGAKRDDAIGAANVATITLIGGGVLAAAGATLFLVGGSEGSASSALRVEAAPVVGLGEAAMTVRGRF